MALTPQDLSQLRSSVAIFAALTFVGIAASIAAVSLADGAEKANREASAQRSAMVSRLERTNREAADIHRKLALFHELAARFGEGRELRGEWKKRIVEWAGKRGITELRYEMAPRRSLESAAMPGMNAVDRYEFMASTMKMRMQLRHEGDLLGFLADLGDGVQALVHVRGCDVRRRAAWLDAECTIDWITLRLNS